jgi:hypothetical protein
LTTSLGHRGASTGATSAVPVPLVDDDSPRCWSLVGADGLASLDAIEAVGAENAAATVLAIEEGDGSATVVTAGRSGPRWGKPPVAAAARPATDTTATPAMTPIFTVRDRALLVAGAR